MVGLGAVGARAARQAHSVFPGSEIVVVTGRPERGSQVLAALGTRARLAQWEEALAGSPDAVILCGRDQAERGAEASASGAHVVSTSGATGDVEALLALDRDVRGRGRTVVVGAAFSPGLSCVLARHGARKSGDPHEVRVAAIGAGGPACAADERRGCGRPGREWDAAAGGWVEVGPGSGRELCWFPEPVSARDCYRGEFSEAVLLHDAFPAAGRISARRAASRVELALGRLPAPFAEVGRLLARRPRVSGPDKEGEIGAVRVDVAGAAGAEVLGAIDRPAVAAGTVAALAARWAVDGRFAPGASGLAGLVTDTPAFLGQLAERGIRAATLG